MSSDPVSRLGSFPIERELGRGGMGVVYLARDPKLNRHVAIKVLPPAVANHPDSIGRFRREATLLAALNHPNVAAIHSVEEAGAEQLLVLEYVPGPTLADVLADPAQTTNGRLPIDRVLSIAAQIAAALEAAHEHGIIHRDLKPANIKVRDDGTVKVLDFGLAKSLADDAGAGALSDSPTQLARGYGATGAHGLTDVGVILGTAAYMSPEQARGRSVDKRADLWAFGVVVYEMLTGERLFAGETAADVIASVVTREPDWTRLPADTPASLRRLLRRCLEKDQRKRLRDASDARLEIEDAQAGGEERTASTSTPTSPADGASRLWRYWPILAFVAIMAVAGPLIGYLVTSSPPDTRAPLRYLTVAVPGLPVADPMSPDGAWLATVYENALHVRRFDSTDWRELPGTTGGSRYFGWSPDSRFLAFAAGSALKKVELAGGRARTICDPCMTPDGSRGVAWTPSGALVVAASSGGLRLVSADGTVSTLTTLDRARGENSHRFPTMLPDGRRFQFTARRDNGEHEIQVGSLDGARPTVVTSAFSRTIYRDGYLFFTRGRSLLAQPFDPVSATLSGTPTTIETNIRALPTVADSMFSVGSDGTLTYGRHRSFVGAAWFDASGRRLEDLIAQEIDETLRVSPDGTRVAVAVHDLDKASTDIYVVDTSSGARVRLTSDPEWDQNPVWSPDGTRIAYRGTVGRQTGVYMQDAAGGNVRLVVAEEAAVRRRPVDWSSDGRILASAQTGGAIQHELIPIAGGAPARVTDEASDQAARFSPDGRFIAYSSRQSGSMQVHVRAVDSPAAVMVTTAGGTCPVWSRDGSQLFYVDQDRWIAAIPIRRENGRVAAGPPKRIMWRGLPGNTSDTFDVNRTGRFLMEIVEDDNIVGDRVLLTVVQNWKALPER